LGSTSFPWTSGAVAAQHGANGSRQRSAVPGEYVGDFVPMMPTLRLRGVPTTWPVPISNPATAGNQGTIVLCIFISHFSCLVTPQREYLYLSFRIGKNLSLRIGSSVSAVWARGRGEGVAFVGPDLEGISRRPGAVSRGWSNGVRSLGSPRGRATGCSLPVRLPLPASRRQSRSLPRPWASGSA
jgi:hypothetical protein